MIRCIHDTVLICIHPPTPAEITRITGTELGCPIYQLLEWTFERQWVGYCVCIIVKSLTGHIDHAGCSATLCSTCRRSRDDRQ
jgi:hypothetical protein